MKEFLEKFKEIKDTIEKNENIILTAQHHHQDSHELLKVKTLF